MDCCQFLRVTFVQWKYGLLYVMQDSCKPILGVAVDSQDEYLDHIEELTHKLCIAEKSIAVVKVCLC